MALPDPSTMTMRELESEFRTLAGQIDVIANRRTALARELHRRTKDAAARARLLALSDDQKDALRRALEQEGR